MASEYRLRTMAIALAATVAGAAFPAASAQAPGEHYAPGETVSYERYELLWGPGSVGIEPFKVVGNIYYVGAADISAYLITTPAGHILIDTGTTRMIASIRPAIEKLGFKPSDIKVMLNTHAHIDHIEAHEHMRRMTGAAVIAMEQDAPALAAGRNIASPTSSPGWAPITIDRIIKDGDNVRLGGVTMHAILTPGHTKGATAWVTTVQDGGRSYQVVFGGLPNPVVGNPKFDTPPEQARTSFRRLRELKPDIFLPGHIMAGWSQEKLAAMRAGARPHALLADPVAWTKRVDDAAAAYERRLQGGAGPAAAGD